jgi:hypothetical protein
VWAEFQALATERGKTFGVLLGEVVEDALARGSSNEAAATETSTDAGRDPPREAPSRPLIGFGRPVIRIR